MSRPDPDPDPTTEAQLWRQIVENYGERASVSQADAAPAAEPEVRWPDPEETGEPDPATPPKHDDIEDHYVPPEPPRVDLPKGARAAAWTALLGGPALILALMTLKVVIPGWLGWFVFLGFVGGFGYLVATMHSGDDDRDGWDDGSRI